MRDVDVFDFLLLEKSLLVVEDLLEEVLVDLALGWTIVLY